METFRREGNEGTMFQRCEQHSIRTIPRSLLLIKTSLFPDSDMLWTRLLP